jgi:hypothetical protein
VANCLYDEVAGAPFDRLRMNSGPALRLDGSPGPVEVVDPPLGEQPAGRVDELHEVEDVGLVR